MKLINKTKYKNLDLSKIIRTALRENNKIEGPARVKHLRIEIVPNRNNGVSGYAYLGGTYMRLRVHPTNESPSDLAWLFIHELYHIRGYKHEQMGSVNHYRHEDWKHYNDNFSLSTKVVNVKPKPDLQIKRYERVMKLYEDKTKQLDKLRKQLKKLTVK